MAHQNAVGMDLAASTAGLQRRSPVEVEALNHSQEVFFSRMTANTIFLHIIQVQILDTEICQDLQIFSEPISLLQQHAQYKPQCKISQL